MKTRDEIAADVVRYAGAYRSHWQTKDESYWFHRLVQEVGELGAVMVGDHEDTVEHELTQVATIAINWLCKRAALSAQPEPPADPVRELFAAMEAHEARGGKITFSSEPAASEPGREEDAHVTNAVANFCEGQANYHERDWTPGIGRKLPDLELAVAFRRLAAHLRAKGEDT